MKVINLIIAYLIVWTSKVHAEDLGVLWESTWKTAEDMRTWNISLDDLPKFIMSITDFLLSIAWTISVIFIIIWAYQMLFGSLTQQKTAWRDTIIMALVWFAIAACAYLIIRLITDNISDFLA